jgi:hypothetical protein
MPSSAARVAWGRISVSKKPTSRRFSLAPISSRQALRAAPTPGSPHGRRLLDNPVAAGAI